MENQLICMGFKRTLTNTIYTCTTDIILKNIEKFPGSTHTHTHTQKKNHACFLVADFQFYKSCIGNVLFGWRLLTVK
jgi:hypothetical protein